MEKQPDTNNVEWLTHKKHDTIHHHCIIGVKRMKVDTTPVGLKNRVGE